MVLKKKETRKKHNTKYNVKNKNKPLYKKNTRKITYKKSRKRVNKKTNKFRRIIISLYSNPVQYKNTFLFCNTICIIVLSYN